jgi:hypothetical protein
MDNMTQEFNNKNEELKNIRNNNDTAVNNKLQLKKQMD